MALSARWSSARGQIASDRDRADRFGPVLNGVDQDHALADPDVRRALLVESPIGFVNVEIPKLIELLGRDHGTVPRYAIVTPSESASVSRKRGSLPGKNAVSAGLGV